MSKGEGNKFVLYRDIGDGYRWRLRGPDGETLAEAAHGHEEKAPCEEEMRPWPTTRARGFWTPPSRAGPGSREGWPLRTGGPPRSRSSGRLAEDNGRGLDPRPARE